eukprot:3536714-Rhodomonas_salina.3
MEAARREEEGSLESAEDLDAVVANHDDLVPANPDSRQKQGRFKAIRRIQGRFKAIRPKHQAQENPGSGFWMREQRVCASLISERRFSVKSNTKKTLIFGTHCPGTPQKTSESGFFCVNLGRRQTSTSPSAT